MTFQLPPASHLTGLALRVRDLESTSTFYRDILGLKVFTDETTSGTTVTPEGQRFTLRLEHDPDAPLRPYPSVGLYHFALLLPDRASLGRILRRLVEQGWELEGAADHAVSEALYLRDPEYNGIELYRDRPQETWRTTADGGVAMVTEPLDLQSLIDESPLSSGLHPATKLGHMHLHVHDLDRSERLYEASIGMNMQSRFIPTARFLAAGGYHHHLGINTWARGRRAPDGSTGLLGYSWEVPAGTLERLERNLDRMGVSSMREGDRSLRIEDETSAGVLVSFNESIGVT